MLIVLLWKAPVPEAEANGQIEKASSPGIREMVAVLRMPALWVVIVLVFFSWTFYTVFDQQMFPDFYTGLFETKEIGERTYGVLNSVQVFVEAAMMGVVPIIMRKVGVKNTLLLGFAVMTIRVLGCAVFSDPIAVSCVKMLHSLEVPLCILPIFRYFTLHFDTRISATLYMVGFQIAAQVGQIIFSTPLGALHDSIGYQSTFLVISGIVCVASLYAFVILKKDDQQVDGQPL